MKNKTSNNTIIYITNQIEEYIDYLKVEPLEYNFYEIDFDSLSGELKKIKNIERGMLLIIINKEFANDKVKEEIRKIFLSKFNIPEFNVQVQQLGIP